MWFIRYKVKCLAPNREEDTIFEEGLVQAQSYTAATRIIEDYYGGDLLEVLLLRYVEETVLNISKETLDKIEDEVENGV